MTNTQYQDFISASRVSLANIQESQVCDNWILDVQTRSNACVANDLMIGENTREFLLTDILAKIDADIVEAKKPQITELCLNVLTTSVDYVNLR